MYAIQVTLIGIYSKYCHASASDLLKYGSIQQICQNCPLIQFFWNFDILIYDMNSFQYKNIKRNWPSPPPPSPITANLPNQTMIRNIHIINHIRKTLLLELFHIFVAIYKRPINYWKSLKCVFIIEGLESVM